MKRTELFDNLLEQAKRFFDKVELSRGDFKGGMCLVRDEKHLILNKNASLDTNLKLLCSAMASLDINQQYLLPAIREAIEKYSEA